LEVGKSALRNPQFEIPSTYSNSAKTREVRSHPTGGFLDSSMPCMLKTSAIFARRPGGLGRPGELAILVSLLGGRAACKTVTIRNSHQLSPPEHSMDASSDYFWTN
jgi:hypothetical protein